MLIYESIIIISFVHLLFFASGAFLGFDHALTCQPAKLLHHSSLLRARLLLLTITLALQLSFLALLLLLRPGILLFFLLCRFLVIGEREHALHPLGLHLGQLLET